MGTFKKMIEEGKSQKELAAYLDSLSHAERLREVESIPGNIQEKLFQIAAADTKVEDLVPSTTPPLKEVIFYGKNSLPVMNIFQKRMCRSSDGSLLWGYNHQSLKWLTGPGCFIVANETDRPGEVMIDYTKLPTAFPPQWPAIKSNNSGITALVYGHMKDYMRRVSKNVFIGEATKKGKKMGQYFLLCRE